ncbi:hypothetical protein GR168_03850 [Gordonia sp. JH63]|uniref:BREX system Lon protease-like protein BrxL n=1 Tax=Gordonia sp. JH63 TaxID=2698900 RepID=UPI0013204A96|nr:BREX system Lon protease-like protein BrxL [Gordonia sp. JH63]QHD84630.1 hypothetical protein GR168_03850 [Gordonia sp. JH63]
MLAHSDLFEVLPASYYDAAYLDRLHCYLPGWEVEIIRRELFTDGYGFVVDYLAEALRHLRTQDFSDAYAPDFVLSEEISTRDRDGVRKTFSGLMKLIHPHRGATGDEVEELLRFAMEGRKRVKDQILRIDRTMDPVRFGYKDSSGSWHSVTTQEELDFPHLYHRTTEESGEAESDGAPTPSTTTFSPAPPGPVAPLRTGALDIPENAMGYSFEGLLIPHLRGAKKIEIVDPYIRAPHQLRNLYELLVEIIAAKPAEETVAVHVRTAQETERDDWKKAQLIGLSDIMDAVEEGGIEFTCDFENGLHDRQITTDNGWRIQLGRGLDIFQPFVKRNNFDLRMKRQDQRRTRSFTVTYLKT